MTAVLTGSESGAGYTAKAKGGRLRAMQCPRCHLENPPSTDVCDCGYSFATGSYVPKPSNRSGASPSAEPEKTRYAALEMISSGFRLASWLVPAVLVVTGIAMLLNSTDQQKAYLIPAAIGCFLGAAGQWLVLKATAEAIILFVDIAYDVRAIAVKINSSDAR